MEKIKLLQGEVNDRVALAQARIEAAVAAIQSGCGLAQLPQLQSSLHRYFANNVWLIASQHAAAFEQGLVELRGLEPLTPSLRTRGMAVAQASLSTDLGAQRHEGPGEDDGVAVPNCCTSARAGLQVATSLSLWSSGCSYAMSRG